MWEQEESTESLLEEIRRLYAQLALVRQHAIATHPYHTEMMQQILDHSPALIMIKDVQSRYLMVGEQVVRGFNRSRDAIVGKTDTDLFLPEIARPLIEHDQLVVRTCATFEFEEVLPHADGLHTYLSVKFPLVDGSGIPYAVGVVATDITDYIRDIAALRQSEEKYRLIFSSEYDAMALFDGETGMVLDVNPAWQALYGYDKETALTLRIDDISAESCDLMPTEACAAQGHLPLSLQWHRQRDGTVFPVEVAGGTFRWNHRQVVCTIARDVTERLNIQHQLHSTNQQLARSLNELEQRTNDITMLHGMSQFFQNCCTIEDAYRIITKVSAQLFENQPGALYILDMKSQKLELRGAWGSPAPDQTHTPSDMCWALATGQIHLMGQEECPSGCQLFYTSAHTACACIPLIAQDEALGIIHLRNHHQPASEKHRRWEWLAMVFADRLSLALANLQLRERLRNEAIRDPLTNLFNRRYMDETLQRELRRAQRHTQPLGIIILDIDHFKHFNTVHGHRGGDVVLRAVGNLLQETIRSDDIVCRLGGEEFVLILPGASLESTYQRAEQVRQQVKELRIELEGNALSTITVSLGVASFPTHGNSIEALFAAADDALGQAKRAGRDCTVIATIPTIHTA